MEDLDTLGPIAIAVLMSLGALCIFIWSVLSGALVDSDKVALRFYRAETGDDGNGKRENRHGA
jgi:hypothetical protein